MTHPMLRLMSYLSGFAAAAAVMAAIFCFVQIPIRKQPTEEILGMIQSQFADHPNLTLDRTQSLNGLIRRLRWNDYVLTETHSNLWWTGTIGFALLAVINSIIFWLGLRCLRLFAKTGHGSSLPASGSDEGQ